MIGNPYKHRVRIVCRKENLLEIITVFVAYNHFVDKQIVTLGTTVLSCMGHTEVKVHDQNFQSLLHGAIFTGAPLTALLALTSTTRKSRYLDSDMTIAN